MAGVRRHAEVERLVRRERRVLRRDPLGRGTRFPARDFIVVWLNSREALAFVAHGCNHNEGRFLSVTSALRGWRIANNSRIKGPGKQVPTPEILEVGKGGTGRSIEGFASSEFLHHLGNTARLPPSGFSRTWENVVLDLRLLCNCFWLRVLLPRPSSFPSVVEVGLPRL